MSDVYDAAITRSALGRVAHIGDLYDVTRDQFIKVSILENTLPPECIRQTDIHDSSSLLLETDSLAEKMQHLDVSPELGLSVLSGLVDCSGSCKYLTERSTGTNNHRLVQIHRQKTVYEELSLSHRLVRNCLFLEGLETAGATHVVTGIEWGANFCVLMEERNSNSSGNFERAEYLGAGVNVPGCVTTLDSRAGVTRTSSRQNRDANDSLSIRVEGDILPYTLPQTAAEVKDMITSIPSLMQQVNNGKGKAITYHLVSLNMLHKMFGMSVGAQQVVRKLSAQVVDRAIQLYDQLDQSTQKMCNFVQLLKENEACIDSAVVTHAMQMQWSVENMRDCFNRDLASVLVDVRAGKLAEMEIKRVLEEGLTLNEKIVNFDRDFSFHTEKCELLKTLQQSGILYIGRNGSLDNCLIKSPEADIYVLYYFESAAVANKERWLQTFRVFHEMVRESRRAPCKTEKLYVFLDCGLTSKSSMTVGEDFRIAYFIGTRLVQENVMADPTAVCEAGKGWAKCEENVEIISFKPNVQARVVIPCPASLQRTRCRRTEQRWYCCSCKEELFYDFKGWFYCSCGRASASSFGFKCSDPAHGVTYARYDPNYLQQTLSRLKQFKEINILILGETGVGKSTWINGFVNALTHGTVEEAMQEPLFVIPVSFQYTDRDFNERLIAVGTSDNEVAQAGHSATQEPKAYFFFSGDTRIRLIDTPGVGDTRGPDQDKQNFESILSYISNIEELHGICILLKPNESRLTLVFQYCITELLTRLHRDAAKNMTFVFTNARGTSYRPGDTMPTLKTMLKKAQNANIELAHSNVFCMDNETVRYLACVLQGIEFSESEHESYQRSWQIAADETDRLFRHIMTLEPHQLRHTLSVHESRRLILVATQPLAVAMEQFTRNIDIIKSDQKRLQEAQDSRQEMAKGLTIQVWQVRSWPAYRKRTVCTAPKCISVKNGEIEYVTVCHDDCGQKTDLVHYPNERLRKCSALKETKGLSCRKCGCGYAVHKHIDVEQEFYLADAEDSAVADQLYLKDVAVGSMHGQLRSLQQQQEQLELEIKVIYEIASRFGKFLKDNAIIPHNDCIESYIQLKLKEVEDAIGSRYLSDDNRRSLGTKRDHFNQMLKTYCSQRKVLEDAMNSQQVVDDITPETIATDMERLYALPNYGSTIRTTVQSVDEAQKHTRSHQEVNIDNLPRTRPIASSKSSAGKLRNKLYKYFALGYENLDLTVTRHSSNEDRHLHKVPQTSVRSIVSRYEQQSPDNGTRVTALPTLSSVPENGPPLAPTPMPRSARKPNRSDDPRSTVH